MPAFSRYGVARAHSVVVPVMVDEGGGPIDATPSDATRRSANVLKRTGGAVLKKVVLG